MVASLPLLFSFLCRLRSRICLHNRGPERMLEPASGPSAELLGCVSVTSPCNATLDILGRLAPQGRVCSRRRLAFLPLLFRYKSVNEGKLTLQVATCQNLRRIQFLQFLNDKIRNVFEQNRVLNLGEIGRVETRGV